MNTQNIWNTVIHVITSQIKKLWKRFVAYNCESGILALTSMCKSTKIEMDRERAEEKPADTKRKRERQSWVVWWECECMCAQAAMRSYRAYG